MSFGGNKTGIDTPSFQNVDLTPGMESSGAAIANRYSQLGLGDSTMATQDQNANLMAWDTQQAQLNNQFAQQQFQDQLALNNASGSGGFGAGLASAAKGIGL